MFSIACSYCCLCFSSLTSTTDSKIQRNEQLSYCITACRSFDLIRTILIKVKHQIVSNNEFCGPPSYWIWNFDAVPNDVRQPCWIAYTLLHSQWCIWLLGRWKLTHDVPCVAGFRESLESDNRFTTKAGLARILLA